MLFRYQIADYVRTNSIIFLKLIWSNKCNTVHVYCVRVCEEKKKQVFTSIFINFLVHISTTVRCLTATHNTLLAKLTIKLVVVRQLLTKVNITSGNNANVLEIISKVETVICCTFRPSTVIIFDIQFGPQLWLIKRARPPSIVASTTNLSSTRNLRIKLF